MEVWIHSFLISQLDEVVSFMHQLIYSRKSPRYPLQMRLEGPQCPPGRFEEEKKIHATK
jgi:hypothetical protein